MVDDIIIFSLSNNWYEYVEYGTTNKVGILLYKNGLSHEAATYLSSDEKRLILRTYAGIKLRMEVLSCERESVRRKAMVIRNNIHCFFDLDML